MAEIAGNLKLAEVIQPNAMLFSGRPSLQYPDEEDPGGVADMSGVNTGDSPAALRQPAGEPGRHSALAQHQLTVDPSQTPPAEVELYEQQGGHRQSVPALQQDLQVGVENAVRAVC